MGYLVVTYCKTEDQAVDLVDMIGYRVLDKGGQVVAIYAYDTSKADKGCVGMGSCIRGRNDAYVRTEGGWMAHHCGRRKPDWRNRLTRTLFDLLGLNLLGRDRTPRVFQNPPGYGPEA